MRESRRDPRSQVPRGREMRSRNRIVVGATTLCLAAFVLLGSAAHAAPTAAPSSPGAAMPHAGPSSRFVLPATHVAGGIPVSELSGLAWDARQKLLYGVSDRGYLYHFRLRLDGDAIVSVEPIFAATLATSARGTGRASAIPRVNAEAVALVQSGDGAPPESELVVALEAKPPQIARFSPKGSLLGYLPVPPPVDDIGNYRKKGRGLESVALHPRYGLLTAPESPLEGPTNRLHTVYAEGRQWSFPRHTDDSRLKAIDVLADGSLLVLERSQVDASSATMVASLRRVDIAACDTGSVCKTTSVATLPPGPENFEGLAVLDARRALIASDNGGRPGQGTVFALIALP